MSISKNMYTLTEDTEPVLFKEKGSKFYAYGFRVSSEAEIKQKLQTIKKEHYQARHWCYAWRLGVEPLRERANDDGEPTHSAGQPILGQLKSFELTNCLVIVVRYFGGVKLGVGGLIRAYKNAAKLGLENAAIMEFRITKKVIITFDYHLTPTVMSLVKKHRLTVSAQNFTDACSLEFKLPNDKYEDALRVFQKIYGVSVVSE